MMKETTVTVVGEKNEITIKEIYERVIQLETKFDLDVAQTRKDISYFRTAIFFLLALELIDIILTIVMILVHFVIYAR